MNIDLQKNNNANHAIMINNDKDHGNDFENIVFKENQEINLLLKYLSNSEKCIFARMSGSGSCCFAVYEKQEYANRAHSKFKKKFPNLWSFVGENNTINN